MGNTRHKRQARKKKTKRKQAKKRRTRQRDEANIGRKARARKDIKEARVAELRIDQEVAVKIQEAAPVKAGAEASRKIKLKAEVKAAVVAAVTAHKTFKQHLARMSRAVIALQ